MARRAASPDEFQSAHYALEDLLRDQPVENEELFRYFETAESAGQAMAGRGDRTAGYVAKFLHQDLIAMGDAEVVPPLDEKQRELIAGKVGFYASLRDKDHAPRPKALRSTPTEALATTSRKR